MANASMNEQAGETEGGVSPASLTAKGWMIVPYHPEVLISFGWSIFGYHRWSILGCFFHNPNDIKAALGKSKHKSIDALRKQNELVKAGKKQAVFSSLAENVKDNIVERISNKFIKRYGGNTALVVRDISGVDWDWDLVIGDIRDKLFQNTNPFDKGVWIINHTKTNIFRVDKD